MIRQTGMKIENKGNINGLIPFAGTLLIEGEAINSYLRSLENPQHIKWEIGRAENESKAKKLLSSLLHFIKASLNEMKNDESEESLDPTVGEYLAASEAASAPNQERKEAVQDSIKDFKVKVSHASPPKNVGKPSKSSGRTFIDDEEGETTAQTLPGEGGSGSHGHGGGGGNGGGDAPGNGGGNTPSEHRKSWSDIPAARVRNVVRDKACGEYTVIFTPEASASDGCLELFMSAESQTYDAAIVEASCPDCPDLQFVQNRITNLTFTEGKPLRLSIRLDYQDYCSLEVTAYGNKI